MIDIFCQNMEITLIGFLLGLLLMLIPVYMIQACGARFLGKLAMAFVGMLVKCAALGAVLWLLQSWHSIAANVCAALLLMVVAALVESRRARLPLLSGYVPVLSGMVAGVVVVGLYYLFVVLGSKQPFEMSSLMPVVGMLCGGMLSVNAKALMYYRMGLRRHGQMYYYLLGNGATRSEALSYFRKRAMERVVLSYVSAMSRSVVASTPFVLWTAVACGLDVLTATALQVTVIVAMFSASAVTMMVTLAVASHHSFDAYGRLKGGDGSAAVPQTDANAEA